MHSTESGNVPAFLHKLWKLVEDTNYDNLIHWSENGKSFVIRNQSKFSKELLPMYFKHSNMASFVRQLNMYGFRKIANIENSGLRVGKDEIEFHHPHFLKNEESQLELIKRKMVANRDDVKMKHEDLGEILNDMKVLKERQASTDTVLNLMQRENQALWREVASMRQKHMKQQQIVEKLLHFLLSLAQSKGLFGVKRKAPLLLDETFNGGTPNKIQYVSDAPIDATLKQGISSKDENAANVPTKSSNTSGLIIHDVTDLVGKHILKPSPITLKELTPEAVQPKEEIAIPASSIDPLQAVVQGSLLGPESPEENGTASKETHPPSIENPSIENIEVSKLDLVPSESLSPSISFENLPDHLEGVDTELNWLQEQLVNGGLNIDNTTLYGLFGNETMPTVSDNEIIGNEVAQYNPTENLNFIDSLVDENISKNESIIGDEYLTKLETPTDPSSSKETTEKELNKLNSIINAANKKPINQE